MLLVFGSGRTPGREIRGPLPFISKELWFGAEKIFVGREEKDG
jgi:hypothetical protein